MLNLIWSCFSWYTLSLFQEPCGLVQIEVSPTQWISSVPNALLVLSLKEYFSLDRGLVAVMASQL